MDFKSHPLYEGYLKISQIAAMEGIRSDGGKITRAAIYSAIKKGKLKAIRIGDNLYIHEKDLKHYQNIKYDRKERRDKDGNKIFDLNRGTFTLDQSVIYINNCLNKISEKNGIIYKLMDVQAIYYRIRIGIIKCHKYGGSIILEKKDLDEFINKFIQDEVNLKQISS